MDLKEVIYKSCEAIELEFRTFSCCAITHFTLNLSIVDKYQEFHNKTIGPRFWLFIDNFPDKKHLRIMLMLMFLEGHNDVFDENGELINFHAKKDFGNDANGVRTSSKKIKGQVAESS